MSVPLRATSLSILKSTPAVNTAPSWDGKLTFPGGTSAAAARRVYDSAPTVGPCITTTGCNENYSQIVEAAMIGNAHYNSLQATLDKRMSHGLQFMANYTWSKSYDDMPQATRDSNTEDINAGESYVYPLYPSGATNIPAAAYVPDIKALDRGLSDIDHPQAFSVSYEWAPPKVTGGLRVVQAILSMAGRPPVSFRPLRRRADGIHGHRQLGDGALAGPRPARFLAPGLPKEQDQPRRLPGSTQNLRKLA
jgi:hypothetical protein